MEKSNNEKKMNVSREEMNKKTKQARDDFESYLKLYLESTPRIDRRTNELEIRFGTKSYGSNRPISKIDYDNVVKQLLSFGFHTDNKNGIQMLRIRPEYIDVKTGIVKTSNIRAEIIGINMVEEYCKFNDIQKLLDMPAYNPNTVSFTQKMSEKAKDGTYLKPINFEDMNFRISYQVESDYQLRSPTIQTMIANWSKSKFEFRYMNRVRFIHPDYPIFADLSIVRSSKTRRSDRGQVPITEYTVQKANLFKNPEVYEIEFELDNARVGSGTQFNDANTLMDAIRKCIRVVLSGIQGTNYPIPISEKDDVLESYMNILYPEKDEKVQQRKSFFKPFIGPSSVTLQMENIIERPEGSIVPNIRSHYTVTDKADGDRALLFINNEGLIYFIDKNMNVMFTGCKTNEKTCYNSILDGEHIKYNKTKQFINLYAAFDIYFINGKSVREKSFIPESENDSGKLFRLPLLNEFVSKLKVVSIIPENNLIWKEIENKNKEIVWMEIKTGRISKVEPVELKNKACRLKVKCKQFYATSDTQTIFNSCSSIFSNIKDGQFEYNTDGLIFTPSNTGVGSSKPNTACEYYEGTWNLSFKWKPAEFNTVDFLVSIVKDRKTGKDKISHIYQDGGKVIQYKTIELRCGFDKTKHVTMNPFNSVLLDIYPKQFIAQEDKMDKYVPMPFQPSDPYDTDACFCNISLIPNGSDMIMTAEESGEYFEEDMIVEFRYDITKEVGWRWIPIRVRYDKTQKLRSGKPEYGNAYPTANSNWKSIHYPVTEEMISSGLNIPEQISDQDVYYNKSSDESHTKAMRNFHNLYVKRKLIISVANREDILIDYAVGKAGDLQKWNHSKLSFVFGIDISRDNIHNELDGACTRYLKERSKNMENARALFVVGNSSLNIRSTNAFVGEKDKMVCKAVFGNGPKDSSILGQGVYRQYGVGVDGFNISSCQFALHYFFENPITFHGFLRNLAECTRIQGYFIGTCYDGKTLFNMLKDKMDGESISFITESNNKICEITKKYTDTGFPDDETSIGYPVDVFQETINKTFREYLVNFQFLIRMMENYGFVLITTEEAKQLGLPNNTGLFSELFTAMENELKRNSNKLSEYKDAIRMSTAEKSLSFINRYFVFKKTTSVKAAEIERQFLKKSSWESTQDDELIYLENEIDIQQKKRPAFTGKIRKLKAKIILQKYISPIEKQQSEEDEDFLDVENETNIDSENDIQDTSQEILEETELPFEVTDEKPIVLKPKVVISDKKVVIKKKSTK
jgi:ribosomal protein L31